MKIEDAHHYGQRFNQFWLLRGYWFPFVRIIRWNTCSDLRRSSDKSSGIQSLCLWHDAFRQWNLISENNINMLNYVDQLKTKALVANFRSCFSDHARIAWMTLHSNHDQFKPGRTDTSWTFLISVSSTVLNYTAVVAVSKQTCHFGDNLSRDCVHLVQFSWNATAFGSLDVANVV